MIINVNSASDCQELTERIQQTLSAKGYNMNRIRGIPKPFPSNDKDVLEALSEAILTRQANFASIVRILPALKVSLSNYNINSVAALTDSQIRGLAAHYKGKVQARFFEIELFAIRDNAIALQPIMSPPGSVCTFIKSYLPAAAYNPSCNCYIRPADSPLIKCFTDPGSKFKLHGVGLAICCEFFNNIGIDECKPDVHTISFLNRISLDSTKVKVSRRPDDVRGIGIRIADTLQKPRAFVDSHMWVFCAEDEGEICTEDDPKCTSCMLKTQEPQLCLGFPDRTQIASDPLGAATRFRECNLTRRATYKKIVNAGLSERDTDTIVTKVYGPERTPKVKWEDIETYIKADPSGSAQMMKQSGLSYADNYKYMKKAGLAPAEIDRILSKVYSSSKQ